jgi:hypothetical protein
MEELADSYPVGRVREPVSVMRLIGYQVLGKGRKKKTAKAVDSKLPPFHKSVYLVKI